MLEEYIAADIVVFCSLFEGFGMPIIEAQAIGRPVVTSDRSPMREVTGSGALLVDPKDVSSIRQGIETLISNPDVAESYRRAGLKNAEAYQVSTIADQYFELYQEIFADSKS